MSGYTNVVKYRRLTKPSIGANNAMNKDVRCSTLAIYEQRV